MYHVDDHLPAGCWMGTSEKNQLISTNGKMADQDQPRGWLMTTGVGRSYVLTMAHICLWLLVVSHFWWFEKDVAFKNRTSPPRCSSLQVILVIYSNIVSIRLFQIEPIYLFNIFLNTMGAPLASISCFFATTLNISNQICIYIYIYLHQLSYHKSVIYHHMSSGQNYMLNLMPCTN